MIRWLTAVFLPLCLCSQAQEPVPAVKDSSRTLNEVVVQAYASDRPQLVVPATLGIIKEHELNRFGNVSLLPAFNMVPGVRMEERSPGSYRFSIRGSSLRSPFGVRNVKFYWNGLPLTDGGGNTYLNLIDFSAVGSMEIIKGPGGSLYGAGTGGVVLLRSPKMAPSDLSYSVLGGSYGLLRVQGGGTIIQSEKFQMDFRLGYQKADGYRQQTNMNRLMGQVDWQNNLSKNSTLRGTIFSSQLYYQTPGGLTLAQYNADPQQARPSTPAVAGAVDQQAAVTNKTTYGGLTFEHVWGDHWVSHIGMFGSMTNFSNPTIRNYEVRLEENWGGRADTQFEFDKQSWKGKITAGAEYQHFFSPDAVYDNNLGTQGNLQTDDRLRSQLFLAFAQAELELPKDFYLTIGGSGNFIKYNLLRVSVTPEIEQERDFSPVFSPRVAVLKKISPVLSAYGSISSGFSPPSLAEVRPSTGAFNNTLNPEMGTSYEVGIKGMLFKAFQVNIAVYDFQLKETIVIQRDASGADYFVNAGATSQKGAEIMVNWSRVSPEKSIASLRVWTSYSYNRYRFKDYVNDGKDYSGNALTGVPPATLALGGDVALRNGFYANVTAYYSDRLPLNDANTDYANDYYLLGTRLGYRLHGKVPLEFFGGVDNAFDAKYSLGNDLNAVGGRYYNAAPRRNFYLGLTAKLPSARK